MRLQIFAFTTCLLLLISLYFNYKQFSNSYRQQKRIETIASVNGNAIQTRYKIKVDSVEHVVYKEVLVKTDAEKQIASQGFADTLVNKLKLKISQLEELTRVRAVVSDTVKVAIRDSVNYVYENKWLTARLNTNTRTLQYSYNVELIDVKYTKGNWLTGKRTFRDISIADPNAHIYSVQRFSLEPERKKRLGVGLFAGYRYDPVQKFTPTIGVGLSYQIIQF